MGMKLYRILEIALIQEAREKEFCGIEPSVFVSVGIERQALE